MRKAFLLLEHDIQEGVCWMSHVASRKRNHGHKEESQFGAGRHIRLKHIEGALDAFSRAQLPLGPSSFSAFYAEQEGPGTSHADGTANMADQPLLPKDSQVWYTDSEGKQKVATILRVHYDDVPPYYTISIDGEERSTVRARLTSIDEAAGSSDGGNDGDADDSDYVYVSEEEDAKYGYEMDGIVKDEHGYVGADIRRPTTSWALNDKESFIEDHMELFDPEGLVYEDEQSTCENPMCCHGACYCRVVTIDNIGGLDEDFDPMPNGEEQLLEDRFQHMVRTHACFAPHACNCTRVRGCRNNEEDLSVLASSFGHAFDSAHRAMGESSKASERELTLDYTIEGDVVEIPESTTETILMFGESATWSGRPHRRDNKRHRFIPR